MLDKILYSKQLKRILVLFTALSAPLPYPVAFDLSLWPAKPRQSTRWGRGAFLP